jgi:hypothetical protein
LGTLTWKKSGPVCEIVLLAIRSHKMIEAKFQHSDVEQTSLFTPWFFEISAATSDAARWDVSTLCRLQIGDTAECNSALLGLAQ